MNVTISVAVHYNTYIHVYGGGRYTYIGVTCKSLNIIYFILLLS